jgi:hypothetical protein
VKINLGKLVATIGRVAAPIVKTTSTAIATALVTAAAEAAIGALNKPKASSKGRE